MIKQKGNKKNLCACGCGKIISNAKIKRGNIYVNRKHYGKAKVKVKTEKNPRPKSKKLAQGKGIKSLLEKCYRLGLSSNNSILWVKDKRKLDSIWEVYDIKGA